MNKFRVISIPSIIIRCLAIFLISLLLQSSPAQAAHNLPSTPILGVTQQQDGEPDKRTARLGENRGSVSEGSSEIWTYEGQAGNVLTIKAEADKPANDASTLERSQAGLLDMILIVYAPDGTIIAKADDIQPGIVTDAVIEGLALPTDGTYKIEVLGLQKEGSGAYTLTLQVDSATLPEATPRPDSYLPTLTIQNELEETICYVYIWPTSTDELGDEWLGTKEVISPNNEHQWHLAPDEYNIVLSDCYGNTLDQRQSFDVTESSTLTVSSLDDSAAQCAEGLELFFDDQPIEAFPKLSAGFAGRENATFADLDDEGRCALALGLIRDNMGNRSGALEAYQVALDIFQASGGNRELEGITLNNIGGVYNNQGKYLKALEEYKKALSISREVRDRAAEGSTLHNIGAVYDHQGKYLEALEKYEQALEFFRAVGHRASEAATLTNIGAVYTKQGKHLEALEEHEQALEIFREERDRAGEGNTLHNIGEVYSNQGKYLKALEKYNKALSIFRDVGNRAGEGSTLNHIGAVYSNQGKYKDALEEYNKALSIRREVGDRAGEGITLHNIGAVYSNQGKYKDALEEYNKALSIRREVSDRVGEGSTLNDIGLVYSNQGKYKDALEKYEQALEIFHEVGNRAEGSTTNNMGLVYYHQGKYDEALKEYEQALEIFREVGDRATIGTTLHNIGLVYSNQEKYLKALEEYKKALEIRREVGDRAGEGNTLHNIGAVYRAQGKYLKALEEYEKALEIFGEVGDPAAKGTTLSNIGLAYEEQDQASEALLYYKQAMEIFEAVRATAGDDEERASFIAQHAGLYEHAIDLYHQQGQEEDAFVTSERGRARSFLDSLATGEVQLSDDDLQELLAREREAYDKRFVAQDAYARARGQNPAESELVAELEVQFTEAEEAYSKVLADIEAQGGKLEELITGHQSVLDLPAVQALLDERTTLVSYSLLGNEGTLAFIMTQDTSLVVELPEATPDKLQSTLSALYGWPNLENPSPDALKQLHSWLIGPLEEHLRTPQVGIIPHQLLHYVPFAALTDGQGYFGEQHTLFVLPSASSLQRIQETVAETAQAQKQPALVFGNPTTSEELELTPLLGAADEARAVAELLGVPAYLANSASEERLWSEANNAQVLHLSAHGVYVTTNPFYNSAVFLAPSDEGKGHSDGRLEVAEVYGLDLTATELVVLSACETSINDLSARDEVAVSASDEVVGLTRAFLFAGTPTVVASLWPVDDESTKELMVSFYRHWQDEGMSKGEALAAAQAEIREKYPSPYYWAGFVLSGSPGESTASVDRSGWWLLIVAATILLVGGWVISRRRRA